MVKFRLNIIIIVVLLCVVLPPVLYVGSIQVLEHYAENHIRAGLKAVYLGDTRLLFNGSLTLQEAIRDNVDQYLTRSRWLRWGGKAVVTVQTRRNTLIYPLIDPDLNVEPGHERTPFEIAAENYRLINEGLELSLVYKLPANSGIADTVLVALILLSLATLLICYRRWSVHLRRQGALRAAELERWSQAEAAYRRQLASLEQEHSRMAADIERMKSDLVTEKQKAEISQEEMLEEIIALEEKIASKEELHARQSLEVNELRTMLEQQAPVRSKENERRRKPVQAAGKRLTTLYKNLEIHERAVEGFVELTEELKLKCEEVMVQLNENPGAVQVKRKVFGKKNRVTVLEVVFGYKGRLYFIPKGDKRAELITIGTKNSQQQDLAYIERL
jgi:hypothetical protein